MRRELRAGLGGWRITFIVLGAIIGLLMLTPLLIVVPTSWTAGQLLEFPPKGFSLQWYDQALTSSTWIDPVLLSVRTSLQASVLATVAGTMAAFGVRRLTSRRGPRLARTLFILPLTIPYVSYALGIYQAFVRLPESLADSTVPLALAQATITFPLVYVIVAGALGTVDPAMSRAAATMGARWPTVLWRIELPLVRAAIVGGWVFAFSTCFDEATLALFLSPIGQPTLPQQLYREASESIEPTLSAVSVMITALALVALGLSAWITSRVATRRLRTTASGAGA